MKETVIMNSQITLLTCALLAYTTVAALPRDSRELEQRQFDTPQEAADALVQAAANFDPTAAQEIVGPEGKVYEKDLGNDTLKVFQAMDRYNSDKSWQETTSQVSAVN